MKYSKKYVGIAAFMTVIQLLGCAQPHTSDTEQIVAQGDSFVAKATAYYPDSSALQGGFLDRKGAPLYTLQQFLLGQAPYVSVAMDVNAFPYGTVLAIPEIDIFYQQAVIFKVVDTGGAFKSKGTSRIDICVKDLQSAYHPLVNKELQILRIE